MAASGTNRVRGEAELYALDHNGMPHLKEKFIVFPAPLQAATQVLQKRPLMPWH
jgi:hypothetical protein